MRCAQRVRVIRPHRLVTFFTVGMHLAELLTVALLHSAAWTSSNSSASDPAQAVPSATSSPLSDFEHDFESSAEITIEPLRDFVPSVERCADQPFRLDSLVYGKAASQRLLASSDC